jgi:hypothetical protein
MEISHVLILEDEDVYYKPLAQALNEIDPKLNLIRFRDLQAFHDWFAEQIRPPVKSIHVPLVIGKIQFLGPQFFPFISRLKTRMGEVGFCPPDHLTRFVLTSFDDPDLKRSEIESRVISNVIFKPFDFALLKQHLRIALAGTESVNDSTVYQLKASIQIEMLKDVQMIEINEVGFASISYRAIAPGSLCKYYIPRLRQGRISSVYARAISCTPLPGATPQFRVEFLFTAMTDAQVKHLRLDLLQSKNPHADQETLLHAAPSATEEIRALELVAEPHGSSKTREALSEKFSNIRWLDPKDPTTWREIDLVIVNREGSSDHFFSADEAKAWNAQLSAIAARPSAKQIRILATRPLASENDRKSALSTFTDIVEAAVDVPLDRLYLFKRLARYLTNLTTTDKLTLAILKTQSVIMAGNLVDITEISEAGLTIKYYRSISEGAFRRFCLTLPHDEDDPEFIANCYLTEPRDKIFHNQFTFFGVTDHALKHIRGWMLHYHVEQKQKYRL